MSTLPRQGMTVHWKSASCDQPKIAPFLRTSRTHITLPTPTHYPLPHQTKTTGQTRLNNSVAWYNIIDHPPPPHFNEHPLTKSGCNYNILAPGIGDEKMIGKEVNRLADTLSKRHSKVYECSVEYDFLAPPIPSKNEIKRALGVKENHGQCFHPLLPLSFYCLCTYRKKMCVECA